ncbi:MAG: hypothetical protein U9P42_01755 [Candidatus Fermentibacteria bacterium]|nr:hypothetical protein [Candidatus Fermentibacteria bacterium]
MTDTAREYRLLLPVLVSRGNSMIDRNVVLAVLWLASAMLLGIPLWILLSADLPLGLRLGIFIGMQLAGLPFYIPLILCHKNNGFRATSDGDSFSWAIFRRKTISWSTVTQVSVTGRRQESEGNSSVSFLLQVDGMKKPVKLHFEERSGKRFEHELKERELLL